MNVKKWETEVAGRKLVIETGWLAQQANGAVKVSYGDTVVLATATMSKGVSENRGFFPLMVDYEEKFYAAGKIKGSRFIKREGRPSDEAVLTGRLIDRTIRPLFDQRMRSEVQVVVTVLSIDQENDPDIVSIIAASSALHLSDIPWGGPVAAVRVGKVDDELVINPLNEQRARSSLHLTVSGNSEKINMIEAGANDVKQEAIVSAFELAQKSIAQITELQEKMRQEAGKEKIQASYIEWDEEFEAKVREILSYDKFDEAVYAQTDKLTKYARIDEIKARVNGYIEASSSGDEILKKKAAADYIIDTVSDEVMHKQILENELRPDGRKLDEVRPLDCQVGVLPRPHGSGLFTRGETQALTVTTLGAPGMQQLIDTMEETDVKKRYMHHYNFPAYSVGEVRPNRGPGRREIGHGALAERALEPMIPEKENFPYTIRVVSEILASNGSSSMASVCGSTLSLMHAGVPLKKPVSGIAMGLIIGENKFKVLSDIQGMEDHYGDIDFKVAGTKDGITALQMDVKVDGVNIEMLKAVLDQAYKSRMHIMAAMLKIISEPNKELSPYAPRIITLTIKPEKIKDVIGPGGKMINKIIDETGVEIDIEDDGMVSITSTDGVSAQKAKEMIENIVAEVEVGKTYKGKVVRILDFGAFVEILPGKDGMVHISKLSDKRVDKVTDVVNIGDEVLVKVIKIDEKGRVDLSLKDAAKIMQ